MDMCFDVGKVFQDRLAASMGLDKYRYIMEQVNNVNVATDIDFQRTFNGFYIVRRNEEWRKCYYEHFENIKTGSPTFESNVLEILNRLFRVKCLQRFFLKSRYGTATLSKI